MKAKKVKKWISLLLATTMAWTVTACTSGSTESKTGSSASTVKQSEEANSGKDGEEGKDGKESKQLFNTDGKLPIVNEPVTLKILTVDDTTTATGHVYTQKIWDWLTEKTGIKFEIEAYVADQMATKLPLIMAENNHPDIFMSVNLSSGTALSYGSSGKLLAMDELYEKYAMNIKAAFERYPEFEKVSLYTADGHIYALPKFDANAWSICASINNQWLDNLGLSVPGSLDELYEVLVQFRDKDANGNGDPKDEIPMTFINAQEMGFKNTIMGWVGISQFWPIDGCTFDADENGKVFLTPISEKYRYLLRFLNKCYNENLLDHEMITHTADEFRAKQGENRIGVSSHGTKVTLKDKETVIAYSPLALTSEMTKTPVIVSGAPYNPNIFSISAATKYPEVCFLLADYMYSEEYSYMVNYGIENETFTWTDKENNIRKIVDTGNPYYLFGLQWLREEWRPKALTPESKKSRENFKNYNRFAFQHFLVFSQEETDSISELSTDMASVVNEYFVKFIIGDKSIETDWDEYVKKCKSLNADELTEMYQKAYDRFMVKK